MSLTEIASFIDQFASEHRLSDEAAYGVHLAVEEIFTNMVKYSTESTRDIAVGLETRGCEVVVCVTDFDVEAFDPTGVEADMQDMLDRGSSGGRGIYLVKQLMDRIEYTYDNRVSKVIMVKQLEADGA